MPFRARRGPRGRLGHRHRAKLRMRRQHAVKRPQERPAAPLEVLPGIFAVENDRDGRLFPAARLRKAPACLDHAVDEVRRGHPRHASRRTRSQSNQRGSDRGRGTRSAATRAGRHTAGTAAPAARAAHAHRAGTRGRWSGRESPRRSPSIESPPSRRAPRLPRTPTLRMATTRRARVRTAG